MQLDLQYPDEFATVDELFNAEQRGMAAAVREERRPGLFVFAIHPAHGRAEVGRCWFAATETPRSGVVGRHDFVDLPLPLDPALSLRHVLFVVRRHRERVRFAALDLGTPRGLFSAHLVTVTGAPARLLEFDFAALIQASEFLFVCVPTGEGVPWDVRGTDPFRSLKLRPPARVAEATSLADRSGDRCHLELRSPLGHSELDLTQGQLARGALIGRYERCELRLDDPSLSRVHAALLDLDGTPWIFDTGSTNGLALAGEPIRSAPLGLFQRLELSDEISLRVTRL
ncbi:MAG: FHA domain-containing protein [Myxococcaceae bacterium]